MTHSVGMNKRKDLSGAVEMYKRGLSVGDVARTFGVSRQSMWKCLQRRGVAFRPQLKFDAENHFYRGGAVRNINWVAQKAIRRGILTVGPCEVCGLSPDDSGGRQRIHAHHDDYNKPLSVRWLCKAHHDDWHKIHRPTPRTTPKRTASEIGAIGGRAAQAKMTDSERAIRMQAVRDARRK